MARAFQIRMTLRGTPQLLAAMKMVQSKEHRRAQKAMEDGAGLILDYSDQIVPLDTGALQASRFNVETENSPRRIAQTVGYGDPAAMVNPKSGIHPGEYAVTQHEDDWFHKNGRERYYLRKAIFRKAQEWIDLLRKRLKV